MGIATVFLVMENRAEVQVGFEIAEGGLDTRQQHIGVPQLVVGKFRGGGAQQINALEIRFILNRRDVLVDQQFLAGRRALQREGRRCRTEIVGAADRFFGLGPR